MSYELIDGRKIADEVVFEISKQVQAAVDLGHRRPRLAVILVGDDPASQIYVGNKEKRCQQAGIDVEVHRTSASLSQDGLNRMIFELNQNPVVDGILLQLPLPPALDAYQAISAIAYHKDVDGLTPANQGSIQWKGTGLYSCSAMAIIHMLHGVGVPLAGKVAAVVGHGVLVGAPTTSFLIKENVTPIVIHKATQNPKELCRLADIVVVATGTRHLIDASWLKDGVVVIDGGIHRYNGRLVGDVDFESAKEKASHITPVPGGVGPVTVAMLTRNVFDIYSKKFALANSG